MKTKNARLKSQLLLCLLLLSTLNPQLSTLFAQGTAFTYQGRLNNDAISVDGLYDLKFALFQNPTGGSAVLGPITNSAVSLSNGLFTTLLDFGPYDADAYGRGKWLEISVRTNGPGVLIPLSPRQPMTPAPSAIFASFAGGPPPGLGFNFTNLTSFNPPSGPPFTVGSTNEVLNLNADLLDGLDSSAFWKLGGNAGVTSNQFVGTIDNAALTLKVNNKTALQIAPGTTLPNLVGGLGAFKPSFVASGVSGAVIAGGNAPSGGVTGLGAGDFQAVYDNDGVVGGGFGNKVGSNNGDVTDAAFATVGGGVFNTAGGYAATVAGGDGNFAGAQRAFVAGGFGNQTTSGVSAIGGGQGNTIQTNADHSTIAGGFGNLIQVGLISSFIGGGNSNSVQLSGLYAAIAGGYRNSAGGAESVVGGGAWNVNNGPAGIIAGGEQNYNLAIDGTIAGGSSNTNLPGPVGGGGTIGGGLGNVITNDYATIPGGVGNLAGGQVSFAAGWQAHALHDGTFVWADSQGGVFSSTAVNQFLIRAGGGVGIGTTSPASALHVRAPADVEISIESADPNGRRYSLQSSDDHSGVLSGSFQVIDRTVGVARVVVLTNGNVGIGTSSPTNRLHVAGGVSATAFVSTSDRNAKENIAPVSPTEVLAKVAALPISTWNFKDLHDGRHMGPMAQDFYAAFGLGGSDTTITSVDPDGVALAAIQGLNQKLTAELEQKETEITDLKQRLAALEKAIRNQKPD